MLESSEESEEITISCYENDIPDFVPSEIDRLYENLFSSIVQFKIYGDLHQVSTYVVKKNGRVTTLLLFVLERARASVLNEVICISEEEVNRFSNFIFSRFPQTTAISFKAIETDTRALAFPFLRVNILEDIVLQLPASIDEYTAQLGKSTRKTIKAYTNKLKRSFPTFEYKVYANNEASEQHVRDVIALNQARMRGKNRISSFDEAATKKIILLVKEYGLVSIATIDGKICAGSISYRVGNNYFMSVNAHDPAYDDYRLGTLSGFFIISTCIERGGNECHMLWGQSEYKYRFLGVRRDLDRLAVYRSYFHVLHHVEMTVKTLFEAVTRKAKSWLLDEKNKNSLTWKFIGVPIKVCRNMSRLLYHPYAKSP